MVTLLYSILCSVQLETSLSVSLFPQQLALRQLGRGSLHEWINVQILNEKHASPGENIPPCGRRLGTKFSLDVTTHPGQWGQVAGADSVFWLTSANDKPRSSLRAGKPFPAAEAGHYAGVWYWELWRLSIVITGGHICNPRTRGRTVSTSQSEARVSDHWPMRGRVRVTPAGARTPGITTGLQSQVGIIRGCNNKDTMRVLLKHFASIIN